MPPMKSTSKFVRYSVPSTATIAALVALTALTSMGAASCSQPPPKCTSVRGDFAATYKLTSPATGECSKLTGDVLGLATYNASKADGYADFDKASLAIQAEALGNFADRAQAINQPDLDAQRKLYAFGPFSTAHPSNDFCEVPAMNYGAQQNLPALPLIPAKKNDKGEVTEPEVPATVPMNIKYEWSNTRLLVTADAVGTQMSADLTYTENRPGNGGDCTATYHVVAVYPSVSCADDEGKPDIRLCSPNANPDIGMAQGSGLNPDFPITCDPVTLRCVLTEEPPAWK